ncbi:MAG: YihA family ribosome biogenesis GTP-binding protein [Clostridium sp.]|nr:YihA family ribosome biogenesis GTP-binding protein [Clostridium sp.]
MIIRNAELKTVCGITSRLPDNAQPEFAFCGKSNVGKSSLINALMNRKSLARTSSTPGKTQTINYYLVNDAFYYVDLPGYGFAKASEKVKAQWGKLIEDYLHQSRAIRAVFLLVDIRHAPGENDLLMLKWIRDHGYTPLIIATKADKLKRSQVAKQMAEVRKGLGLPADYRVIAFSSETKQGRDEIWEFIDSCLEAAE